MAAWWINRVLPGIIVTQLALVIAYLRLHFEQRWPYWGRYKSHAGREDENDE